MEQLENSVAGATLRWSLPQRLHDAAVRCEAHERRRLEQLCRYLTRPALSDVRLQFDAVIWAWTLSHRLGRRRGRCDITLAESHEC